MLNDNNLSLDEKLEQALELGASDDCPYAAFFHGEGHGALHDRLSLAMCETVRPHLRAAFEADARLRGKLTPEADELAAFQAWRVLAPSGTFIISDAWQPAPACAIMNAWMPKTPGFTWPSDVHHAMSVATRPSRR